MGKGCKYRVHFSSKAARDILNISLAALEKKCTFYILKKKLSNKALINQYSANHCILIGLRQNRKESERERIHERNSMFWSAVHCVSFSNLNALKPWFKLSTVKCYRNDLKGNKSYFEFNSKRFELSRVTLH